MWLRDGLPNDLEGARVLSYGYDSKLVQSETFQSVDTIAKSFLESLRSIRVHDRVSELSQISSNKLTFIGQIRSSASDFHFTQPGRDSSEEGMTPLSLFQPNWQAL